MNRLGAVNSQLDAATGQMPPLIDSFAKIDASTNNPTVAAKAKALYKQQYDLIETSRKEAEENASRTVAQYDAKGEVPPQSIVAQMNPKQQAERLEKNFDPVEYERIRQQVSYGQPVNLEEYRWRMTPKQFSELNAMQGDPNAQSLAREIDKRANNDVLGLLGKSMPKTKQDYERIARYRDVIYNDLQAQQRATGKAPTVDEVTKIADRMAITGTGRSMLNPFNWGGGDDQYDVTGIPRAQGQYTMGGEPVTYPDLVAALTIQARALNLPVSDDVLAGLYQDAMKSGKLADKYK